MNHPSHSTLLRRALILIVALLAAVPLARAQEGEVLDEIVAVVSDDIILKSEVDGFVIGVMNQQGIPYSEQLWADALRQLVNERVLVTHARRDTNLTVSDQQVEQMLNDRIDRLSRQMGGQARVEDLYGQTIVEIKAEFREQFRDQLLADQIRNNKLRSIKATPTDVRRFYETIPQDSLPEIPDLVRVSHIVRMPEVTPEAREEAMEIITTIRDSVVAGGSSFEEMARLFSEDPGSASQGGLYQDMPLSELVPEFAAVAARSQVGEISRVFESRFGLHFLRVNARRGDRIDYNHILIQFDERKSDPTAAIEMLETLRDSIVTKGASFERLAREYSEEESSSVRGGRVVDPTTGERDLELQALGPDWRSSLIGLEEGEISEPSEVELLDGRRAYHIVRLDERIPAHRVSLETDYDIIKRLALQEKQARVMQEWLKRLRESVYIDIRGKAREMSIAFN